MSNFNEWVGSLFMSEETIEIIETPVVIEEDPIVENTPEYMDKSDVEALIAATVEQTINAIKLAKEESKVSLEELKTENKAFRETIAEIKLELEKPAKKAEVVIPTVKNSDTEYWSMANAVK